MSKFLDLLCLLIGALLPLAFAPIDAYWLAWLLPGFLVPLWLYTSPRRALLRGWLFGCGFFGVGVSWVFVSIHVYGAASMSLATLLTTLFVAFIALFYAGQAWCFRRLFPHPSFVAWCIGFPLIWALWEWIRSWLLSGFPWLYLGYSQLDTVLSGYIPVIGVYGTTFIVVTLSALFLCGIFGINAFSTQRHCEGAQATAAIQAGSAKIRRFMQYDRSRLDCRASLAMTLCALIVVFLLGYTLSLFKWTQPNNDVQQLSLIQGNIPQDEKWDRRFIQSTINKYTDLTAQHWDSSIIIWPEAALPIALPESQTLLDSLGAEAKIHDTTLITGLLLTAEPKISFYNSIIAVGTGQGVYAKQNLVPFGEYVPFASILRGVIHFFDLPSSRTIPGEGMSILHSGLWKIAPLICYEISYADLAAEAAHAGNIILTVSNDTWFGRSWGPKQHLQIAQFRAKETGRMVIRATNNGITAIIDQKGNITAQIPAFEAGVLTATADTTRGLTPIVRIGHTLIICILFIILALCIWINRRGKK